MILKHRTIKNVRERKLITRLKIKWFWIFVFKASVLRRIRGDCAVRLPWSIPAGHCRVFRL